MFLSSYRNTSGRLGEWENAVGTISWVHHTRLLGVIIDHKLTWSKHLSDLKRNFSKKLKLLKKCSFLKRIALLDLYFKVILPSVTYGIIVWGVATTLTTYKHLEHCIAGQRELSSICHGTHLWIWWWKSLSGTQYLIYTNSVLLSCFTIL